MPTAPSASPLLGAPQEPGDEPNLPEGSESLGEGPLRPKENIPVTKPHPAGSVPPPARPTEMMDWSAETDMAASSIFDEGRSRTSER